MSNKFNHDYIKEIDGLRAIAVLSVLLYHMGFYFVGGGFIGVDVFFVISGYLITGILIKEKKFDVYTLKKFYFRRIIRIAPALFSMLVLTIFIFFLITPPIKTQTYVPSAISAIFSYSNFWFYNKIDYFTEVSNNPFLHTWSLSIEEQFYLFLPFIIWVCSGKFKIYRRHILGFLFITSFIASIITINIDQSKAFYFPWLRAWELLAGSILSTAQLEKIKPYIKLIFSNIGLILIIISCISYNKKTLFPGIMAVIPVVGAVGIIAGAGIQSIANWILCIRPMRFIGHISYSLYLVHWPIICIAGMLFNLLLSTTKISIVVSSLLLAWLSWRYIEVPTRSFVRVRNPKHLFSKFVLSCICLVPYTLAVQSASASIWERSPLALKYTMFMKTDLALFRSGTCLLTPLSPDLKYFLNSCLQQQEKKLGVLVIGDSHAANIVAGLTDQHPDMSILQATAVGCKPVLDTVGPYYCTALMQRMLIDWLPQIGDKVQYVVIAARWVESDLELLKHTVKYLEKLGKRVIVYGPSPEYSMSVPLLLAYSEIIGLDLSARLSVVDRFKLDKKMELIFSNNTIYFSPIASMCLQGKCEIVANGVPMLSDGDHFTRAGAKRVIKNFPLTKIN